MKNRFKKLSIILAAALVLTTIPLPVFAAEPTAEISTEEATADSVQAEDEENGEAGEEALDPGGIKSTENNENSEEPVPENSELKNENSEDSANGEIKGTENTEGGNAGGERSEPDNDAENNEEDEGSQDTVSDDETEDEETLSENEAEETLSDNELEEDSLSENEVSENEVSENEVSENEAEDTLIGGNIDMTMDFEEETVAEIAEAGEEAMVEYAREETGDMSIDSADELGTSYVSPGVRDQEADATGQSICWAYTAATVAGTNMRQKGIIKGNVDPLQIVKSTYNAGRYDYYGETWNKASNVSDFDIDKVGDDRDYTAFWLGDKVLDVNNDTELKSASGNLMYAAFNFERWASPGQKGNYSSFEGNRDLIDAELENAVWVPNTDINSIKSLIHDYGAAGIQIMIFSNDEGIVKYPDRDSSSNNPRTYKYYPISELQDGHTTNYTVALIGWDDDKNPDDFYYKKGASDEKQPNRKGAFLAQVAKNTVAGIDEEYMWISYDDMAFKLHNGQFRYAVAYDFVSSSTNDYTYGYDGTNYFNSYYTRKVYGIFKSGHTGQSGSGRVEMLKSIGIGVQDAGKYIITIYSGYDPSGTKQYVNRFEVERQTAEFDYPGYHTVELDEPIVFYKNDVISVSLERADATNFYMLVDGFENNNSFPYEYKYNSKSKKNEPVNSVDGRARIAVSGNGNPCAVIFNTFTHYKRENVESYFATASNSGSIVSGNRVPVSGKSSTYMKITPRMRLYTSEVDMPQDIDQSMLDIKLSKYAWKHTGKKITPLPQLMIEFAKTSAGRALKDGGGHEYRRGLVMYNMINDVESHYNYIGVNNTNVGVAAVVVRGKGDIFSGEISAVFKITDKDLDIGKCKIMGLEPQDYKAGTNLNKLYGDIKDNIVVKYYLSETKQYVTLTEGVDYKIGSIEGENTPGKKLSVMITGLGAFTKTTKPKFQLQKKKEISKGLKNISDAAVSVNMTFKSGDMTLDWKEGDPLLDLDYTGQKLKMDKIEIRDQGRLLTEGVDYDSKIKYKNNKNPGMAQVIIKAKKGGAYTGKITRYFMIKPMHVTRDATVKFKSSYTYTGNPIKAIPTVKYFGKKLKKGDIYVAYSNNTGSSSGTAKAQGIVFGKGRYMGYIGTGTFTIYPAKSTTSSSSSKR